MLKADLHIHSGEDNHDGFINYKYTDVIDKASEKGFDVLSFTFHDQVWYEEAVDYAKEKEILLIPGIEKNIEGKHVLLYNFTRKELDNIKHFEDLRRIKSSKHLVIAPHPFFKAKRCLGKQLYKYKDVFDALEISYFHSRLINFNKKAIKVAKKNGMPMIATSDSHNLDFFGRCFTCVDSQKNINSVIKNIKYNKVKLYSPHIKTIKMFEILFKQAWSKNVRFRNRIDSPYVWDRDYKG